MPQDHAQGFEECRRRAQQGEREAQFRLGMMYGLGLGTAQSYPEALAWYRRAAEQGEPRAQNNLGWMYGTGRGVPQDFAHAYAWYSIAAAGGEDAARRNRDLLAAQMGAAQLEGAQKLAGELFERIGRARPGAEERRTE